jgi:hypothetical protein
MNKIAKYIAIIFAVIIVILLGILAFVNLPQKGTVATGSVSMEPNYPTSSDGHVKIMNLMPGQTITSPETVNGVVTGGGWFFEAVFPVKVMDGDRTVLGLGQAQAESDWMTTGTVPFSATVSFSVPHSVTGIVVFSKDNPSGLPQNTESFSVPVRFK